MENIQTDVKVRRVNPLNPKSDQHLISPYNITFESHVKVMRIKEMITNERNFWLVHKFSLSAPYEMYKESVMRKYKLMLGCEELIQVEEVQSTPTLTDPLWLAHRKPIHLAQGGDRMKNNCSFDTFHDTMFSFNTRSW